MFSLNTLTNDPQGYYITHNEQRQTDSKSLDRRVQRSKLLDGSTITQDYGFSHGDRTISVAIKLESIAEEQQLAYLFENYAELGCGIESEYFYVSPVSYRFNETIATLTLYVKEKRF